MGIKFKLNFIAFLFLVLILVSFWALVAGSYDINLSKTAQILAHKITAGAIALDPQIKKMDFIVINDIRLPRIIIAIFVGFSLGVAGCVYQACFRNPLVEPFILGASSGAGFGAAIGIIFAGAFFSVSLGAFVCSVLAVFSAYFLAKTREGVPPVALILSGVIISSIFSALVGILKYLSDDSALREITFWIMGGLYYSSWDGMGVFLVILLATFVSIFLFSYRLNLLSFGDDDAKTLGISPEINKVFFIALATLLTAISVSNVGIIAWVGLMAPHAARLILGADNRFVLVGAGFLGAIYLEICDTIARTISQSEIPIGIVASILGAPFLIWLLKHKKRELMN